MAAAANIRGKRICRITASADAGSGEAAPVNLAIAKAIRSAGAIRYGPTMMAMATSTTRANTAPVTAA